MRSQSLITAHVGRGVCAACFTLLGECEWGPDGQVGRIIRQMSTHTHNTGAETFCCQGFTFWILPWKFFGMHGRASGWADRWMDGYRYIHGYMTDD